MHCCRKSSPCPARRWWAHFDGYWMCVPRRCCALASRLSASVTQVGAGAAPVLSAAEIVVALHHIEASDALPLKKVRTAAFRCRWPRWF